MSREKLRLTSLTREEMHESKGGDQAYCGCMGTTCDCSCYDLLAVFGLKPGGLAGARLRGYAMGSNSSSVGTNFGNSSD